MDFTKKFNVGLTLGTTEREFDAFLSEYAPLINQIYFSPPLGDKFHSRAKVYEQFSRAARERLFWKLLKVAQKHKVNLEVVLNTYMLDEDSVKKTAELLQEHGVELNSVCCIDKYYPFATKYFPGKEYVYSYNNGVLTEKKLDFIKGKYDYIVVGSANIRNNDLFAKIKETGAKVILLLNNGCSFNCPSCAASANCKNLFETNLKTHSLDYLYAQQSLMPFELYDGTVNTACVDLYKTSNRSSDLKYLKRVIDSYVNNEYEGYLKKSTSDFALWAKLSHFYPFTRLDIDKILEYKKQITGKDHTQK